MEYLLWNPLTNNTRPFYHQYIINLILQRKRPATIDAYSRAVRRIADYFQRILDTLTPQELKQHIDTLIKTRSWSTVKSDRTGYNSSITSRMRKMAMDRYSQTTTTYHCLWPVNPSEKTSWICPCYHQVIQFDGLIQLR
ncbi:phage integrase N-terminal SAM-like domain-containing protein [Psychromonas antarctica]|uniref:phage integrase N-terminal SAM-like domain-containing protein n=1 Tax=Psychromonas antarctica TaxID=67573 RepID=UPI001EE7CAD5|nr:phage integrase N-terminal SAM-like domain-containing protein [Psychromonas antarctica]MCG6199912.1 phage integrase N-terminal SAM-like domain-containing protein [Psychromonas antarctica]